MTTSRPVANSSEAAAPDAPQHAQGECLGAPGREHCHHEGADECRDDHQHLEAAGRENIAEKVGADCDQHQTKQFLDVFHPFAAARNLADECREGAEDDEQRPKATA